MSEESALVRDVNVRFARDKELARMNHYLENIMSSSVPELAAEKWPQTKNTLTIDFDSMNALQRELFVLLSACLGVSLSTFLCV